MSEPKETNNAPQEENEFGEVQYLFSFLEE